MCVCVSLCVWNLVFPLLVRIAVVELNILQPKLQTFFFTWKLWSCLALGCAVQGQRLLQLGVGAPVRRAAGGYAIATRAPPSAVILPAGYAMLFAVANGVPSEAAWVHVT
jgi:hypothetical protein